MLSPVSSLATSAKGRISTVIGPEFTRDPAKLWIQLRCNRHRDSKSDRTAIEFQPDCEAESDCIAAASVAAFGGLWRPQFGRILTPIWSEFDHVSTEIWSHFSRNLATFWLEFGHILAEIWPRFNQNLVVFRSEGRRRLADCDPNEFIYPLGYSFCRNEDAYGAPMSAWMELHMSTQWPIVQVRTIYFRF